MQLNQKEENKVVTFLKTSKAKMLYVFAAAFIFSFALVYARFYFPFLRDLCGPINADLDSIQNAVYAAFSGTPMAIFTVLATPLTVVVALVKAFTGKVTSITQTGIEQRQVLDNQMSQMETSFSTQYGELEKSKGEVESSLSSTRTELDSTNRAFQDQSKTVTVLQEENASLKRELGMIRASLG